jgi:cytochrome c biogenesis protein ResB
LFRELSRLRLAVWLLIVMGITMVVGSIFPQGYGAETYIESWGEAKYLAFSKLGLLNLFHTKYFLILGLLLFLNLVVGSIVRLSGRRGAGSPTRIPSNAGTVDLAGGTGGDSGGIEHARKVLAAKRYRILSDTGNAITARRGPWPEGVSMLYHLALAIAIVGFMLSAVLSFEGDVTLWPGEPQTVATLSTETGLFKFSNRLADWSIGSLHPFAAARRDTLGWENHYVEITLDEFVTEWELHDERYYPKDWLSHLTAREGGGPATAAPRSLIVEVNRPLRISGLTFYQMAYEQQYDVVVLSDGEEIERITAESYVPFSLESVGGMFFPGALYVGTLFQKYHEPVPVVPHVPLKWQPAAETPEVEDAAAAETDDVIADTGDEGDHPTAEPAADAVAVPEEPIELGDLSAGEALEIEGVTLMLENPYEASVLSYRHDPGVTPLYIAVTLFMLGLCIRTYWPSYRVSLWIDREKSRMLFRATGMLGEPEDIEKELVEALETES